MKVAIVFQNVSGMRVTEKHIETVKNALPGFEVRLTGDPSEFISSDYNADVLICWATGGQFICEEYCEFATKMKWIHVLSAGIEGFTQSSTVKNPKIQLTNASGIHGIPIAEHVMAYILSTVRGYKTLQANQKEHLWNRFTPEEAYGKTVGILGIGAIGKVIAKRCKAFEMTVLGVKRTVEEIPFADEIFSESGIDEVISRSDFLIMVMPSTPQTSKLIGKEKFALMKQGAHFINVGRGATVDTDALIEALQNGKPAGAMLDALDPEPLQADSPLWDMPNVVISPHVSATSPAYMDRAFNTINKYAPGFLANGKIENPIDTSKN